MIDIDLFEELRDSLPIFENVNLLTNDQSKLVLQQYPSYTTIQIASCNALVDLAQRLAYIESSYLSYTSYPSNIILPYITEESNHVVLNIKDRILAANPYVISIDKSEFETMEKKLPYLRGEVRDIILQVQTSLNSLTPETLSNVLEELYTQSQLIDDSEMDIILQRKLRSAINKIVLQLESISDEDLDKFSQFVQEEIKDAFEVIIGRLL